MRKLPAAIESKINHADLINNLSFLFNSITLIEPGPVVTEFEKKVYEEGTKIDLSAADQETRDIFTNIYLRNYKEIFSSLGQSADEVAEVQILKRIY